MNRCSHFSVTATLVLFLCILPVRARHATDSTAYILRNEANALLKQDRRKEAMQTFVEALRLFEAEGNERYSSLCLYEMAIEFLNTADLENLSDICEELRNLTESNPDPLIGFNYSSVASAYHHLLYLEDTSRTAERDSAIHFGRQSIAYLNSLDSPFDYNIQPVWNYYNQALYYDMDFDEPQIDSVEFYLDGAEGWLGSLRTDLDRQESRISIEDLRAWLCLYRGDRKGAERKMLEVLALIDSVEAESPGTVLRENCEALGFLVDMWSESGNLHKASEYYDRLLEATKQLYNVQQSRSLAEIKAEYDTQKRQAEIDRLKEKNRNAGKLMAAIGIALALAVLTVLLLLHLSRVHKRKYAKLAAESASDKEELRKMEESKPQSSDVENIKSLLIDELRRLPSSATFRDEAISRIVSTDPELVRGLWEGATQRLTTMDKKYSILFLSGMSYSDIAHLQNVETASVYTVRYRLRKKLSSDAAF